VAADCVDALRGNGASISRSDDDGRVASVEFASGSVLTDSDLSCLEQLSALETLNLQFCSGVDETALQRIGRLPNLKKLNLAATEVTDEGLASLTGLTRLHTLELDSCKGISDQGVKHLRTASTLKVLSLQHTGLTDKGLEHLIYLPNLEELYIGGCDGISDSGMLSVGKLTELRRLNLGFTAVSDAAVEHLKGLVKLEFVNRLGSRISDEGVRQLKKSSPECSLLPPLGYGPAGGHLYSGPLRPAIERSLEWGKRIADEWEAEEHLRRPLAAPNSLFKDAHTKRLTASSSVAENQVPRDVQARYHLWMLRYRGARVELNADGAPILLDLTACEVSDAELKALVEENLASVRELSLEDNEGITDVGLGYLHVLGNLRVLDVRGTSVSEAGLDKFKKALPNCRVDGRPSDPMGAMDVMEPPIPSLPGRGVDSIPSESPFGEI